MKILIVDDEDIIRVTLNDDLRDAGFKTTATDDPIPALKILANEYFDVVITDLKMIQMDGMTFLEKIKKKHPDTVVIMITAYGTIQTAVEAMKLGAYDYITKPFSSDELILNLNRIEKTIKLKQEIRELKKQLTDKYSFQKIVGKSKIMREIFDLLTNIAQTNTSVLITGETGTGKEMVANALHFMSSRKFKPYVKVSCAMFSKHLLENELFGHEKGAFTGAITSNKGRFELADGGTIFLDDVDDIPMDLQVKLLRAVQEREIERVGGTETKKIDVRIISASKYDLLGKVKKGEFRDDLFYRLNVVPVLLPPLRERKEDIPLLIKSFVKKLTKRQIEFPKHVMNSLMNYQWPGNVRELENLIERLIITSPGNRIEFDQLPQEIFFEDDCIAKANIEEKSFNKIIEDAEINMIKQALKITNGNKSKAAKILKLKPSTFRSKIEKYNIE